MIIGQLKQSKPFSFIDAVVSSLRTRFSEQLMNLHTTLDNLLREREKLEHKLQVVYGQFDRIYSLLGFYKHYVHRRCSFAYSSCLAWTRDACTHSTAQERPK